MDDSDRDLLLRLLTGERIAVLSVLVDGKPFASLVPFALAEDGSAALIHASQLARHSAGLGAGAPFALLIHQGDTEPETNPAQLARVTLEGQAHPLVGDSEDYPTAKQRYLDQFPKSEITFQLGDFTLYRLEVSSIRFIAGFGKAFEVGLEELSSIRRQ